MKIMAAMIVGAVGISAAAGDFQTAKTDAGTTPLQTLERELATAKSDLLTRDIALSTCRATLAQAAASYDSLVLSDRATRLVEDFKKAFGGEWVWSPQENRPVRPTK